MGTRMVLHGHAYGAAWVPVWCCMGARMAPHGCPYGAPWAPGSGSPCPPGSINDRAHGREALIGYHHRQVVLLHEPRPRGAAREDARAAGGAELLRREVLVEPGDASV